MGRTLSFEEDVLDAFLGVLASCDEQYFGVPHDQMDKLMSWVSEDWSSRPRCSKKGNVFPSWSWISAVGPIEWCESCMHINSVASWFRCTPSDSVHGFTLEKLEQSAMEHDPQTRILWPQQELIDVESGTSKIPLPCHGLEEEQIAIALAAWYSRHGQCSDVGIEERTLGPEKQLHPDKAKRDPRCKNQIAFVEGSARPEIDQASSPGIGAILKELSRPGRILVVAQKLEILLRPQWVVSGRHMFHVEVAGNESTAFGLVHLTDFHAKSLWPSLRQDGLLQATCIDRSFGGSQKSVPRAV